MLGVLCQTLHSGREQRVQIVCYISALTYPNTISGVFVSVN